MKKIVSCLIALVLIVCAVASVSAAISPTATIKDKYLIVDVIPVPDHAGTANPGVDDPGKVEVSAGETVTLTATPKDGYKFDYWEFSTGEFEIISGDLTSPTIVIKPTGDDNVRAYAHFSPIGEDVTVPSSKPAQKPSKDPEAPKTGDTTPIYAVAGSILVVALAAAVILKKRQTA